MIELNKIVETFQSIGEINIKDIKKLYRIVKKHSSPPPYEIIKEVYVLTADSEG